MVLCNIESWGRGLRELQDVPSAPAPVEICHIYLCVQRCFTGDECPSLACDKQSLLSQPLYKIQGWPSVNVTTAPFAVSRPAIWLFELYLDVSFRFTSSILQFEQRARCIYVRFRGHSLFSVMMAFGILESWKRVIVPLCHAWIYLLDGGPQSLNSLYAPVVHATCQRHTASGVSTPPALILDDHHDVMTPDQENTGIDTGLHQRAPMTCSFTFLVLNSSKSIHTQTRTKTIRLLQSCTT